MDSKLVFDIGLYNGDDSRYYLDLGYSVVGVEANPLLAEQCSQRFAQEIAQNRMKVVNVGVLQQAGSFTFYQNLLKRGQSSFVRTFGNKEDWQEMTIPCVTMEDLIAEHGKPYFIKIDIEGADLQALATLTQADCPPYLSVELGRNGPELLARLLELGYSRFKFSDGETNWHTIPIRQNEYGWRLLRKIGRVAPFVRNGIKKLPQRFRYKDEWNPTEDEKYIPDSYQFGDLCSGPFGEKAAGDWITAAWAGRFLKKLSENNRRRGNGDWIWWDIHARHSSVRI